jgi:hypothetical protein
MRARRVKTITCLGHTVQVGFQVKATGPGREPSKLRWKLAYFMNDYAPNQCWSDLVSWVFGYGVLDQPWRDLRPLDVLPWRPITPVCRTDAARNGACYCGKVATAACAGAPNGPRASVIVEPAEASA